MGKPCPVKAVTQQDRPKARLPQAWAAGGHSHPGTGMGAQRRSRSPEQAGAARRSRGRGALAALAAEAAGACPASLWSFSGHPQAREPAACVRTAFSSSALLALLLSLRAFSGTCSARSAGRPRRARGSQAPGRGRPWPHPRRAALCSAGPSAGPRGTEPHEVAHSRASLTPCLTSPLPRCASCNLFQNKLPRSRLRVFGGI